MTGVTDTDAPPVTEQGESPGVGKAFALAFTLTVVLALVVTAVALDRMGASSRTVPSSAEVVVVNDARELLAAWDRAGIHGTHLVDVTKDLQYAPVPDSSWATTAALSWPVAPLDFDRAFRSAVARPSLLWVASKTGAVRSVTYVLSPTDLAENVRFGREAGYGGIAPDGSTILAEDNGYLRTMLARFPARPPAGTVLNIDASYFVNGTAEALSSMLAQNRTSYRFITLDRAQDSTTVPEAARQRLDGFAATLRQGAAR